MPLGLAKLMTVTLVYNTHPFPLFFSHVQGKCRNTLFNENFTAKIFQICPLYCLNKSDIQKITTRLANLTALTFQIYGETGMYLLGRVKLSIHYIKISVLGGNFSIC